VIRSAVAALAVLAYAGVIPGALSAQGGLSPADSALVGRILLAEDRRDSTDTALGKGERHGDERIRLLARRARGRIADPQFAARQSLPPLPPPPVWPEPEWKARYRALTDRQADCPLMRTALADSAWPVRLRAADLADATCGTDSVIVGTLRQWVDGLTRDVSRRTRGGVAWQAGAHAAVALARIAPAQLDSRIHRLARHPRWEVRSYAARAAAQRGDTAVLRRMARDPNDNVKDVAITELARLAGHRADDVYIAALGARGPQAVRSAAVALKGSTHARARPALERALARWRLRGSETEHDVRVALLEALGRPATGRAAARLPLPRRAVPLALGQDVRLRVEIAPASGGDSFTVRLRGDVAPMMAARVLALADSGYYDGLTWQRVEHDFVIQGGSPDANEYVGYPRYFRDELGNVSHVRGTVGMSTRGHDTGDAQWFFNLKDNTRLDRDFTVFAEVTEGMDVVDAILEGDTIARVREVRVARR